VNSVIRIRKILEARVVGQKNGKGQAPKTLRLTYNATSLAFKLSAKRVISDENPVKPAELPSSATNRVKEAGG
jgi:hypothetical protein